MVCCCSDGVEFPINFKYNKSKQNQYYLCELSLENYNTQLSKMQHQNQKLIQDLHYSNGTFYVVMSTLQSLVQSYQGTSSNQYGNKIFRGYDKFDYSSKNLQELKSQLQTHIMVFRNSMILWRHQHPQDQWRLPDNFNAEKSVHFVQEAINVFAKMNDQDCVLLAKDVLAILNGSDKDLYYEKVDFTPAYSESDRTKNNKNLFQNCLQAQNHMDQKLNQIKDVTDPSQLRANIYINPQYQYLFGQKSSNSSFQQGSQNVWNQSSSSSANLQKCYVLIESNESKDAKKLHQIPVGDQIDLKAYRVNCFQTSEQVVEKLKNDYNSNYLKYLLEVGEDMNRRHFKLSSLKLVRYSETMRGIKQENLEFY